VLSDYQFANIDGGEGRNTLVLANVPKMLDLQAAIASARLDNFSEIALPGAQELVIRAADVLALAGNQQLFVSTLASGKVDLVGAWSAGAPVSIEGVEYRPYTSGAAEVWAQTSGDAAVLNAFNAGSMR
jgi:hypothetical protein